MSSTTDSESEWSKLDESNTLADDNQKTEKEADLTEAPIEENQDEEGMEIVGHMGTGEQEQEAIGSEIRKLVLKCLGELPNMKIIENAEEFAPTDVVFTYKTKCLKDSIQVFHDLTKVPVDQQSEESVADEVVFMGTELKYENAVNRWIFQGLLEDFSAGIEKVELGIYYGTAIKLRLLEISLNQVQQFFKQLGERVRTVESALYYRTKFLEVNHDDFPSLIITPAHQYVGVGIVWYIPSIARGTAPIDWSLNQMDEISRLNRKLFDELKAFDAGLVIGGTKAVAGVEFGLESKVEDLASLLKIMSTKGQEFEDAPESLQEWFLNCFSGANEDSSTSSSENRKINDKSIIFLLSGVVFYFAAFFMAYYTIVGMSLHDEFVQNHTELIGFVRENCIEQKFGNITLDPSCHIKWNLRHEPSKNIPALVSEEQRLMEEAEASTKYGNGVTLSDLGTGLVSIILIIGIITILSVVGVNRRTVCDYENKLLEKRDFGTETLGAQVEEGSTEVNSPH